MQARITGVGKVSPGLRMYAWTADSESLTDAMAVPRMQYSDWIYIETPSSIEVCGWPTLSNRSITIWRSAPQKNRNDEPSMQFLKVISSDIIAFTDNEPDGETPIVGSTIVSTTRDREFALADVNFTSADITIPKSIVGRLLYIRNTGANPIHIHPGTDVMINGQKLPWELKAWTTIRLVLEPTGWTGF